MQLVRAPSHPVLSCDLRLPQAQKPGGPAGHRLVAAVAMLFLTVCSPNLQFGAKCVNNMTKTLTGGKGSRHTQPPTTPAAGLNSRPGPPLLCKCTV